MTRGFQFFNILRSLRRFNEKCQTATASKKVFSLIVTILQLAITGGLAFAAYWLFSNANNSLLSIFMIIIAVGLAISSLVLLIYCIAKFIILLKSALRKKQP